MKIRTILFTFLVVMTFSVLFFTTIGVNATAAIPAAEAETDSTTGRVAFYKGGNSAHSMNTEDVIASHFSIAGDATFVGVCCPSWSDSVGNMRVELYSFDTDYDKTISGTPIATNMFENYNDNDFIGFSVTGGTGCEDISIEDGHLHINVTATNDSQMTIMLPYWADDSVYCDVSKAMLVKFRKSAGTPSSGEVFFSTSLFAGPTPGGSVTADYEDTTDWQYAIFNFATNTKYTQEGAILNAFRFDVFASDNEDATFDIEYILFFDNKESALQWDGNFDAIATPVPTEKPVTPTPEVTQAPTKAPVTQAPEGTKAPEKNKEKGGCGSSLMLAYTMIIFGAAILIKKKK